MRGKKNVKTKGEEMGNGLSAFLENEKEANYYAAKCLSVCAVVGVTSWILNLLGIFIIPGQIMNIGMPLTVLFFLLPTLLCRLTGGRYAWVKDAIIMCAIIGVFIFSCAMPKHSILAWTLPIMISCHYYSKNLSRFALIASCILLSGSVYIGMFVGEGDLNLVMDAYQITSSRLIIAKNITPKILYQATLFFVFPRMLILIGLSSICTTVAERTKRLLERQVEDSRERQRISAELNVATNIQADMLPCIFPAFPERPEFDIYASMTPAKEVGGDFYDFFMVDERHLAVVIADVSGKGVPAALFMVIGKTLIKDHTRPGVDLGEVFSEVNNLLCESNREGLFITAFEGVLDIMTGEFNFVNAGHEMPFIARSGKPYEPYKLSPDFVLAGMEDTPYHGGSLKLACGDKIFQYTDGVTEATNAAHELYGMQRLSDVLTKNTDKSPSELLPVVKADIDAFVDDAPQFDDITMLCVEYLKAD